MRGTGDQSQARSGGTGRAPDYADGPGGVANPMHPLDVVSPDLGGMANPVSRGKTARKPEHQSNGGDALVFIAMGLVSAALGLGLYAHVGLGLPVALIAALGLFVSISFLHVFVRRMQGVDLLDRRVTALEDKVSHVDGATVAEHGEAIVAEADQVWAIRDGDMPGTVAEHPAEGAQPGMINIDGVFAQDKADLPPAYSIPSDAGAVFGFERPDQAPVADVYDLSEFESAAGHSSNTPAAHERPVRSDTASEVRSIDGLVRQLSAGMAGAGDAGSSSAPAAQTFGQNSAASVEQDRVGAPELTPPRETYSDKPAPRREAGETPLSSHPETLPQTIQNALPEPSPKQHIPSGFDRADPVHEALGDPVGHAILDAASRGAVDIYLQPILSIDDRKVRFFEVLGRIKGPGGEVIAAEDHVDLARSVDAVARLDRAIMVRSARLLRKLAERRQAQPLFCNISRDTLSEPNFMRDFVEFMGGFRDIAPYLIFEINQPAVVGADTAMASSIRALSSMGFRLSIDQISNVEQALASARDFDFSFLKLPFETFLPAQQSQADARSRALAIHAAARDNGITLVVDKIERKDQLASVVSTGVNLGQGYLFSEPKPLLPQVAAEVADGSVAA